MKRETDVAIRFQSDAFTVNLKALLLPGGTGVHPSRVRKGYHKSCGEATDVPSFFAVMTPSGIRLLVVGSGYE